LLRYKKQPISASDAKRMYSKYIRIGPHGLNLSRSFGDFHSYFEGRGIIQNPKVVEFQLQPGDYLFLFCDGVTDYLLRTEIVEVISNNPDNQELVKALVAKARSKMTKDDGDNITVISFHFSRTLPQHVVRTISTFFSLKEVHSCLMRVCKV